MLTPEKFLEMDGAFCVAMGAIVGIPLAYIVIRTVYNLLVDAVKFFMRMLP